MKLPIQANIVWDTLLPLKTMIEKVIPVRHILLSATIV